MANLDVMAQNIEELRDQLHRLVTQGDVNGGLQDELQQRLADQRIRQEAYHQEIQEAIQQRGPFPEANALRPSAFRGTASEDANRWLKRFISYVEYCNMNEQRKVRMFRLLLEGAAEVWYASLPDDVQQESFNEKFINANNLNWVKEQRCNQLQKGEAETRSIILRGLLPNIKAFVIGHQPETLDDLESKARLAESVEKLKPREPQVDRINMLQENHLKRLEDLAKIIEQLQGTMNQQRRDMAFVKSSLSRGRPNQGNPGGESFWPFCSRCKIYGHTIGNCVRRPQPGDLVCFRCNQRGDIKRECP